MEFELKEQNLVEADEQDERAVALANWKGVPVEEVEETDSYYGASTYAVDGEEYIVATYDEAYDLEKQEIESLIDELGIGLFTESFQDWILNYCVEQDWFEDAERESFYYYIEDIEDEGSNDFENRLIEEMFDKGILNDDDFMVDEEIEDEGAVDYKRLKPEVYLEAKKEEFLQDHMDSISDFAEEFKWNYGYQEFAQVVKDNDLMDVDAVVEECISQDGVGHNIARYDGYQNDLGNDLYAYRID